MSDTQELALKIARLLESDRQPDDLSVILEKLESIDHRLTRLESAVAEPQPQPAQLHVSQERFSIAEAIANEIFNSNGKEKACTFEPNARPCDNCGMCSSRGF